MALEDHINNISLSRITPYIHLCRQLSECENERKKYAIAVYTALQHRSSIFPSIIQEIEIAVRNEIARVLEEYTEGKDELKKYFQSLAKNSSNLLPSEAKKQLNTCLRKLKNKNYSADDIIANLTFGFWVIILNADTKINPQYQHWHSLFNGKLFDNRFASMLDIYTQLKMVKRFRNKLYHQEPVWKGKSISSPQKALKKLEKTYKNLNTILEKVAPERKKLRDLSKMLLYLYDLSFELTIFEEEFGSMVKEQLSNHQ